MRRGQPADTGRCPILAYPRPAARERLVVADMRLHRHWQGRATRPGQLPDVKQPVQRSDQLVLLQPASTQAPSARTSSHKPS